MSSPSTTGRRGPAVDDRVLDCTLALLAEEGYEFGVDQVAERAGVHKTTVYRRYETKATLVGAAVERLAREEVPVPEPGDDPVAALRALALAVARALRKPAGANALRAALAAAGSDSELTQTAARLLASRYRLAVPLVEAAQARGELRADLDPVLLWQAIVNPLHLRAVTGEDAGDDVASALVDLVLRGARTDPDADRATATPPS